MNLPSRQGRLANYLTLATLVFLAAYLLLPTSKAVNNVYYFLVGLPGIVAFFRYHRGIRFLSATETWMLALVVWCLLVALYHRDVPFFKNIVHVSVFFFTWAFFANPERFQRPGTQLMLYLCLLVYLLASALTLYLHGDFTPGQRLGLMLARLDGPIFTGMLMAALYGLLVPAFLRGQLGGSWGLVLFFLITLLVCALLLQTRAALVGLGVIALLTLVQIGLRRQLLWLLSGLSLTGLAAFLLLPGAWDIAESLLARRDAFRFQLWQVIWQEWQACSYLFGCGRVHETHVYLPNGLRIQHPHSVFLSQTFYTGVVSLILMLGLLFSALRHALRQRHDWRFYLMAGIVMLNFDGDLFIHNPDEIWLLLWLPLALLAASERQAAETAAGQARRTAA